MENTSKVLARINSYIGNLENREKEQKLKKVTWTTSLSAALFLTILVIVYKPFESSADSKQLSTSSDLPDTRKIDISKSILVDTLTVTAKAEWASLVTQEAEPVIASQSTPPSHDPEEKSSPKRVKQQNKKRVTPNKSVRKEQLIASHSQPTSGVMRSSAPVVSSPRNAQTVSLPMWEPDVEAKFPGGRAALSIFIQKNVTYPRIKKEAQKEGTVYVRFTIDKWGEIQNAKVVKGLGDSYDQEALNLIQKMPKWIPGKYEGQTVATYKDLGIMYKMY